MTHYEESATVELKRELNADFKKEIVAFANTDGGEIFVGVDRAGTPVGVPDCEKGLQLRTSWAAFRRRGTPWLPMCFFAIHLISISLQADNLYF
jgi:predicted HTH transcriptional regulator